MDANIITQTNTPVLQGDNATKALESLARKYAEVKEIERQVKLELSSLKDQILDIVGEGNEAVAGEFRIQHKTFITKRKVPTTYTIEETPSSRFDVKYVGRAGQ